MPSLKNVLNLSKKIRRKFSKEVSMMKTLIAFCLLTFGSIALAGQQIKLAVLVPEGTTWGNSLKKLSKEVETVTGGEVTFKIYYGGVSGDEPDVVRKTRIGQLHGGI